MKKKITTLLLMSTLALSLVACASRAASDSVNTPEPTVEATVEPTEAPTPEPTEEPTPEPTQAPTPEPVQELPEDRAWVDDLYNKLVALDVDGVAQILNDSDFFEKAAPYEYTEFSMWDYETGYKLVTSDDKIVGIVTHISSEYDTRYAFVTDRTDTNYGFNEIYGGDICIYTTNGKSGYYDGRYDHRVDGNSYDIGGGPNDVWMVWHM